MFSKYLKEKFDYSKLEKYKDQAGSVTELFNTVFDMNWSFKIDKLEIVEIKGKQAKVVVLTVGVPGTVRSAVGNAIMVNDAIEMGLQSVLDGLLTRVKAEQIIEGPKDVKQEEIVIEPLKPQEQIKIPKLSNKKDTKDDTPQKEEGKELVIPGIEKVVENSLKTLGHRKEQKMLPTKEEIEHLPDKLVKLMLQYELTEEEAKSYAKACKTFGITNKGKLANYLNKFDSNITKLNGLTKDNIVPFTNWLLNEDKFTINEGEEIEKTDIA